VRPFVKTAAIALLSLSTVVVGACGGGGGGGGSGGSSGGSGASSSSSTSSASSSSASSSSNTTTITSKIVLSTTGRQTLSGWEVTPRFWEFDKTNNRYDSSWLNSKDAIATALVDQAGITRVRLEVRSGVENPTDYWTQFVNGTIDYNTVRAHFYDKINDNSDANSANAAGFQWSSVDYYVDNFILPLKTKLNAQGKSLSITMTYVDFNATTFQGSMTHAGNASEYAELMTQAALHLKSKYGLSPDAVEIILEPDNANGWTGKAIGNALVAVQSRLATNGFHPKFIAPSPANGGGTATFLDGIATVTGANALLNTVAYHRYDGAATDTALPTIRSRAAALGADTAMLEYTEASVTNFFKDMAAGGASAWQMYGAATPSASASAAKTGYILWKNSANSAVGLTPQFSRMAAVQREVLPGARAYDVSIQQGSDLALDFHNPDGSEVIAVYSQAGSQAQITSAGHGTYAATFAGPNGAAFTTQTIAASGGVLTVAIPADTVVVLHSTN